LISIQLTHGCSARQVASNYQAGITRIKKRLYFVQNGYKSRTEYVAAFCACITVLGPITRNCQPQIQLNRSLYKLYFLAVSVTINTHWTNYCSKQSKNYHCVKPTLKVCWRNFYHKLCGNEASFWWCHLTTDDRSD
jgi:hypothetical protein